MTNPKQRKRITISSSNSSINISPNLALRVEVLCRDIDWIMHHINFTYLSDQQKDAMYVEADRNAKLILILQGYKQH